LNSIAIALRKNRETDHVSSILSKLGVSDRTKAVPYALQNHLV
jgi:DNA-binding NarL/FixJ family response regulator